MDVNDIDELKEDEILFDRDEKGEIIPKWVEVEKLNKKILIKPISRGEWIKLVNSEKKVEDRDAEIISIYLIKPKLTYEQLSKSGKNNVVREIIDSILKYSGLFIEDKKKEQ